MPGRNSVNGERVRVSPAYPVTTLDEQGLVKSGRETELPVVDLIKSLPIDLASKIEGKIDEDHNGYINVHELGLLFHELQEEEKKTRMFRKGLIVAVVMLAFSIAANLGTAWAAYELAKDTEVSSDGTLKTTSGATVRTDSSSFAVTDVPHPDGTAVVTTTTNSSGDTITTDANGTALPSRARRQSADGAQKQKQQKKNRVLKDRETGEVIRVGIEQEAREVTKITSELPDEWFEELELLSLKGPSGSIHFKVTGFARYTWRHSRCGTVVRVFTNMGYVQFDGVSMFFAETMQGAFRDAGFRVWRMRGRRDGEPDGYTLVTVAEVIGKFRFLADTELDLSKLTCGDDVPNFKPCIKGAPNKVEYQETMMIRCGTDEECPKDPRFVQEFKEKQYFSRQLNTKAEKQNGVYYQITEMKFPEFDGSTRGTSLVMVSNGSHTLQYTRDKSGNVHHCNMETGVGAPSISMNDETGVENPDDDGEDEAETDDAVSDSDTSALPFLEFVGYEVLNGVYVRHFTMSSKQPDGSTVVVPYYEHFDQNRMFSMPLDEDDRITTFDSGRRDNDVRDEMFSERGYPSMRKLNTEAGRAAFMRVPWQCERQTPFTVLNAEDFETTLWSEERAAEQQESYTNTAELLNMEADEEVAAWDNATDDDSPVDDFEAVLADLEAEPGLEGTPLTGLKKLSPRWRAFSYNHPKANWLKPVASCFYNGESCLATPNAVWRTASGPQWYHNMWRRTRRNFMREDRGRPWKKRTYDPLFGSWGNPRPALCWANPRYPSTLYYGNYDEQFWTTTMQCKGKFGNQKRYPKLEFLPSGGIRIMAGVFQKNPGQRYWYRNWWDPRTNEFPKLSALGSQMVKLTVQVPGSSKNRWQKRECDVALRLNGGRSVYQAWAVKGGSIRGHGWWRRWWQDSPTDLLTLQGARRKNCYGRLVDVSIRLNFQQVLMPNIGGYLHTANKLRYLKSVVTTERQCFKIKKNVAFGPAEYHTRCKTVKKNLFARGDPRYWW